jgi:xanthine dehydrogenase YagS FAD-binding subunit
MNKITHIKATTIAQATSALGAKAAVIAGGTDLFGVLKGMILPNPPDTLVNIKTIPGMDYIKEEGGVLKIGALAKLTDISEASIVLSKYPALAEAAHKVGTPALRNMGTIGGNLCHNAFVCFRKGGPLCYAIAGDNRYNAILGGQVCFAVCPSDTAIALTALDATLVTTQRNIPIKDFFTVLGNALKDNEIITEVQVPAPKAGTKQAFLKFARRKAIDFAIASASVAITTTAGTVTDARIVLGGVAPVPYRATAAEDALKGKAFTAALAETAGVAAVKDAMPLANNKYKVQIAKTLVKRAILASI